jgi:hypothetical protein
MCQSNTEEADMLTPLSIISLDQGKALARRSVERFCAEPAEPASIVAIEHPATDAAIETAAAQPVRRAWLGQVLAFFEAGFSFAARRT